MPLPFNLRDKALIAKLGFICVLVIYVGDLLTAILFMLGFNWAVWLMIPVGICLVIGLALILMMPREEESTP